MQEEIQSKNSFNVSRSNPGVNRINAQKKISA